MTVESPAPSGSARVMETSQLVAPGAGRQARLAQVDRVAVERGIESGGEPIDANRPDVVGEMPLNRIVPCWPGLLGESKRHHVRAGDSGVCET